MEQYDKAEDLLDITDPETEPYKSKYECRRILQEIISLIKQYGENEHNCSDHLNAIEASLYCLLGCIDVEVQELGQGEKDLLASLNILKEVKKKQFVVLTDVKAHNQLGVLWCIRDDHAKAKQYLDKAERAYDEFTNTRKHQVEFEEAEKY